MTLYMQQQLRLIKCAKLYPAQEMQVLMVATVHHSRSQCEKKYE